MTPPVHVGLAQQPIKQAGGTVSHTKPKCYFSTYFTKPKYHFGTYLTNPNTILTPILHKLKSLTHGKYNYSSLKKYFSYKIYKSPCISPMAKLFIFVGMTKPS